MIQAQPIVEKKTTLFKKRRETKNKAIVMDSPSKDSNSFDSVTITPDGSVGANDKNGGIGASIGGGSGSGSAADTLLNKQTIQEKIKALGLNFFSEDFEGVTASSIQCLACETTTEQKETMIDLSVPITENMETHELNDNFIQVNDLLRVFCFCCSFWNP